MKSVAFLAVCATAAAQLHVSSASHAAAVKVNSDYPDLDVTVFLVGEDDRGFPHYVSSGGDVHFCHEDWGWAAKTGSCWSDDFQWTTFSEERELVNVIPDPQQTIKSFAVASGDGPTPYPPPAPAPSQLESYNYYCGEPFVDVDFPADESVLDREAMDAALGGQLPIQWPPVWQRVLNVKKGEPRMLDSGINFDDPKQGVLGDCWLITAMSSAALKHGDAIKELFRDDELKCDGKYTVEFWDVRLGVAGGWSPVTIDDQVPCDSRTGNPYYADFHNGEVWPMILEKAFAKFVGGYGVLNGGLSGFGYQAMGVCNHLSDARNTGQGYWQVAHSDVGLQRMQMQTHRTALGYGEPEVMWSNEELFEHLRGLDNILANAGCCMPQSVVGDQMAHMQFTGIPTGHMYVVLAAIEAHTNTGEQLQLLRIRNPWAKASGEPGSEHQASHLDWGKDSPKWYEHPEVAQQLEAQIGDDHHHDVNGVFWIAIQDFSRYFMDVEICNFPGHPSHPSDGGHDEL